MTLIYRTTGPWGAGKGANLTPAEVDGNFNALSDAVANIATGIAPAEIENVVVAGNQLTFELSNGETFGPYTLPSASFRFVGVWTPATAYAANDVIETGQGLYLVRQTHTAAATFDPARQIGGVAVYVLMFREPRSQVFTVSDATHQPVAAQVWGYIRISSECIITLPDNATENLPIGVEFHFRQTTGGALTIVGAAGVTVNVPDGLLAATDRTGATVTVKKVGADEWDVFGLLARDE